MRWWLLVITPFVFASELSVPGAAFYRFSDDAGNQVLADKIPPRYVKYGYEVLDRRLFVIHRVAPAPTAEERNGQVSEQTLSEVAQKELDFPRAQQILLEREQRVADLEALYQARKTRVAELTQTEL